MMAPNQQATEIALTLSLEDADALCAVLAEQVELAAQADDAGEYLRLVTQVRNELIAAMAAAHEADSFLLSLDPSEAVCLFLLVNDVLAPFAEEDDPDAPFNVDQALALTHQMVTVDQMQLL